MIDQDIVAELGIGELTQEEQVNVLNEYQIQVGEALEASVGAPRFEEFVQIIDANQTVIDQWLADHAPDYKNNPIYKELTVGYDDDPERVPADKVFASMAWIEVNCPDYPAIVERIKTDISHNLDQYK